MDNRKIRETLIKRLEIEREKRREFFLKARKYLPDIIRIGVHFDLEKIVLFGSITDRERFGEHSDIDIGVTGLQPEKFFKMYAQLTDRIDWPIDLVDLDEDTKFKTMILKKGEVIYDRRQHSNKNLNI